ncbi:MAG: hypothetical protein AAGA65_25905, partial [Actinomycetota bacterium]
MTGRWSGDSPTLDETEAPEQEGYGTGGIRSLFDRMSWAVVAEITNLFAVALVFKVLSDLLSTADYGEFTGVVAIATIVGPLSTFGANWVLIRRGVLNDDLRSETGRAVYTAATGTGVAVLAVIAIAMALPDILPDYARDTMLLLLIGQVIAYWLLELAVTSAVALADLRQAAILR